MKTKRLVSVLAAAVMAASATVAMPANAASTFTGSCFGTGVDEWLNHFSGRAPLTAHYDWISYTAPSGNSGGSANVSSGLKYAIKSVNSGKALDVSWGSKDDGANVQQYSYNGGSAQQWEQ